LEEYLNDPNFEQNRIEYRSTKAAADRNLKNGRTVAKPVEKRKYINSDHPKVMRSHDVVYISVIYPCGDGS
jgi:hypothetical protein